MEKIGCLVLNEYEIKMILEHWDHIEWEYGLSPDEKRLSERMHFFVHKCEERRNEDREKGG